MPPYIGFAGPYFNPRTPQGVRRPRPNPMPFLPAFQSTHPTRGATFFPRHQLSGQSISIHAPHKGCDQLPDGTANMYLRFQSTHPTRGATLDGTNSDVDYPISIHAPHKGCDSAGADVRRLVEISIHAPHKGCDRERRYVYSRRGNFNPRTPQGVRQVKAAIEGYGDGISIHAPHKGCDWLVLMQASRTNHFNPRTPQGVRLPRAWAALTLLKFQSTHPTRGATRPA